MVSSVIMDAEKSARFITLLVFFTRDLRTVETLLCLIIRLIRKLTGMSATRDSEDSGESSSNLTLRLTDAERSLPSVPCYKLTAIAAPLINHLKALMQASFDFRKIREGFSIRLNVQFPMTLYRWCRVRSRS